MSKERIVHKEIRISSEHYEWLNQRIGDLEEALRASQKHKSVMKEVVSDCEKQNKRYREALEFYADENNYGKKDYGMIVQLAIQEGDRGNTAREALESDEV